MFATLPSSVYLADQPLSILSRLSGISYLAGDQLRHRVQVVHTTQRTALTLLAAALL